MEPTIRPVTITETIWVFLITLVAVLGASALFGGCGAVQEAAGAASGGAAGQSQAAGQAGEAGGAPENGGAPAAGGSAGAPATGGASGLGNAAPATGGTGGIAGAPAPRGCGGPGYGAAPCRHDSDCLSGTCAGGLCADCAGGCKPLAKCVDNGWIPNPVQDCSGTAEPLCRWGYRCVNCGPFPGGITTCIYDRATTSICVASCADCAAL